MSPGDLLEIEVFETPELNTTARVNSKGFISMPLAGPVNVLGLNEARLEEKLERILGEKYLQNPQVGVFVKEGGFFYVLGKIQGRAGSAGGKFPYRPGITLQQAIAMAGGFSEREDAFLKRILITRDNIDGGKETFTVGYDRILKGEQEDIQILKGDVVYVEGLGKYHVTGFVRRPGSFDLRHGTTLQEAIAMAGWLEEEDADLKNIQIARNRAGGGKETLIVDYTKILDGSEPDVPVMEGDIVFVKALGKYFVSGYVRRAGAFDLRQDTTLQHAISSAGGIGDVGKASAIQITRIKEDGSAEIMTVNLKRIMDGEAEDVKIYENDIIYVPQSYFLSFVRVFFLSIGVGDDSRVGVSPTTFIER